MSWLLPLYFLVHIRYYNFITFSQILKIVYKPIE